ncbi:hypothetical protein GL300_25520 [Paracoccus litorisediminis]|jgi:virginiamycin A acetyltransferase|uniref:Uncharacterized protein n=2 Tax=Paracoccus litorisediminis TaxID=2006130 RepID=A0A844HTS3_9RHOB|nr:hypothetical protein [Paracoccus litorisediminis]
MRIACHLGELMRFGFSLAKSGRSNLRKADPSGRSTNSKPAVSKAEQGIGNLFSKDELSEFYSLADASAVAAGNIRGAQAKWDLQGSVLSGKYTAIKGDFTARGVVRIGKYCAFGRYVALISGNHRTDMPNQQVWFNKRFGFTPAVETKGPVEVGHNVWIGDKVSVLSGVQIGHGSVIGAGATVVKSVPPFSIIGGSPAREIRRRFSPSVIEQMLELGWWDWDDDRIARNKTFFELNLTPTDDFDLFSVVVD